jgi:hypothetical protein
MEDQKESVFDPEFNNPNAHHLTHQQSIFRRSIIQFLKSYDLFLVLHRETFYEGRVKIILTLNLKG